MEKAGHRPICMEDRLRTLGILDNKDDLTSDSVFDSMKLRGINIEANNMPQKKVCFLAWWGYINFPNYCSCNLFQVLFCFNILFCFL